MKRYFVVTGTVTYAIKGRDVLHKEGYFAEVRRLANTDGNSGCGYGVFTNCNKEQIERLFYKNGVKFLKIKENV